MCLSLTPFHRHQYFALAWMINKAPVDYYSEYPTEGSENTSTAREALFGGGPDDGRRDGQSILTRFCLREHRQLRLLSTVILFGAANDWMIVIVLFLSDTYGRYPEADSL
jgi:hypothetical protein